MIIRFNVGDKVLIARDGQADSNGQALRGQVIIICNWSSGANDIYGCALEDEVSSMKVSIWCHAEQLKALVKH